MEWPAGEFSIDLIEHLRARTMAGLPHIGVIGPRPEEEILEDTSPDIDESEVSSRNIVDEDTGEEDLDWKFVPNKASYQMTIIPKEDKISKTRINFYIRLKEGCDEDVGDSAIERGRLEQYVMSQSDLESSFRNYNIEIDNLLSAQTPLVLKKIDGQEVEIPENEIFVEGRNVEITIFDHSEPFLNFQEGSIYLTRQEYIIKIKKTIEELNGTFRINVTVTNESFRTKRSTLPTRRYVDGQLESEELCHQKYGLKGKPTRLNKSEYWNSWNPFYKIEGRENNPEGNRYGYLMEFFSDEEISSIEPPIGERDLARITNVVYDDTELSKSQGSYVGLMSFRDHAIFSERVPKMTPGLSPSELFSKLSMDNNFAQILEDMGYQNFYKFQVDAIETVYKTYKENSGDNAVLISARTAGGKTEAFSIPIIDYCISNQSIGTKAIVFYPTKALANDQASRFIRLLYFLNQKLERKITLGILHGDVPTSRERSSEETQGLPFECPRCSDGLLQPRASKELKCDNEKCGLEIDFVYASTRRDVYSNTPDIVISNPDTMIWDLMLRPFNHSIFGRPVFVCNECRKTYTPKSLKRVCDECHGSSIQQIKPLPPKFLVFDEVHLFKGSFGINCSFFLSRVEHMIKYYAAKYNEISNHTVTKIGSTATISNAQPFAKDFFNVRNKDSVKIIPENEEKRKSYYVYDQIDTDIKRHHVYLMPYAYNTDSTVGMVIHYLQARALNGKPPTSLESSKESLNKYLQVLTFVNSIRASNSLIAQTNRTIAGVLPDLQVGGHTTDFDKKQRSQVERRFNRQELHTVFATQTLEVGVDFRRIDAVVINGFPYSFNDYLQRIGRGGRKNDSLIVTVCQNWKPVDHYYYVNAKRALTEQKSYIEPIPITRDNIEAAKKHLYGSFLDSIMRLPDSSDFVDDFRSFRVLENDRIDLNTDAINAINVPDYYEEEILPYLDNFVDKLVTSANNYESMSTNQTLMKEFQEQIDKEFQLSKMRSTDPEVTVEVFWK